MVKARRRRVVLVLPVILVAIGTAPASGAVTSEPLYGQTAVAEPTGGSPLFRPVGAAAFVPLEEPQMLSLGPAVGGSDVGAIAPRLDATNGRVRVISARFRKGGTETAEVSGGRFLVSQPFKGKALTGFNLEDSRSTACRTGGHGASASVVLGQLWVSGTGAFHTSGRQGGTIVFGTATWLTQDRCDGTFIKVRKGSVTVQDFGSYEQLRLTAGQHRLVR
jgi:hypothetical protein